MLAFVPFRLGWLSELSTKIASQVNELKACAFIRIRESIELNFLFRRRRLFSIGWVILVRVLEHAF